MGACRCKQMCLLQARVKTTTFTRCHLSASACRYPCSFRLLSNCLKTLHSILLQPPLPCSSSQEHNRHSNTNKPKLFHCICFFLGYRNSGSTRNDKLVKTRVVAQARRCHECRAVSRPEPSVATTADISRPP